MPRMPEGKTQIQCVVDKGLAKRIKSASKKLDKSQADVIREALDNGLQAMESKGRQLNQSELIEKTSRSSAQANAAACRAEDAAKVAAEASEGILALFSWFLPSLLNENRNKAVIDYFSKQSASCIYGMGKHFGSALSEEGKTMAEAVRDMPASIGIDPKEFTNPPISRKQWEAQANAAIKRRG